jgi:hypothetical protein
MLHKRPAPPAALDQIKMAGEKYDPPPPPIFTDPPPPPPGPGLQYEPPDWRAEAEAAARRDAAEQAKRTAAESEAELDPPQEGRPAKPARAKKSKTPNLDEVRAWRKGAP